MDERLRKVVLRLEGRKKLQSVTCTFCRNNGGGTTWFDWTVVGYTYVNVVRRNWNQLIWLFLLRKHV
jgi:hypothetical protein